MEQWEAVELLELNVLAIARELRMLNNRESVDPDPEDPDDQYFDNVRVRVRSFLILCSAEIEEFIETKCLEYLSLWVRGENQGVPHNCVHALTIYFRRNIANLLERQGTFVDFFASPEQARRFASERKKAAAEETDDPPLLNRRTLIAKVSVWYRDEVVAASHGISDQGLVRLLEPLGFSRVLVKDECPSLMSALSSLAAGRGEAAHRSASAGKFPFERLPAPVHAQMSIGDAWGRWKSVKESLYELRDLLERVSMTAER